MSSVDDPRIGTGCGYASVPIRKCEVCGAEGVMWTVPLNGDDSMVLCSEDKRLVEVLRDSGPPPPPLEDDPVYKRLFGTPPA